MYVYTVYNHYKHILDYTYTVGILDLSRNSLSFSSVFRDFEPSPLISRVKIIDFHDEMQWPSCRRHSETIQRSHCVVSGEGHKTSPNSENHCPLDAVAIYFGISKKTMFHQEAGTLLKNWGLFKTVSVSMVTWRIFVRGASILFILWTLGLQELIQPWVPNKYAFQSKCPYWQPVVVVNM